MTLVLHYNKDTYIRKVGLSGLFFVYILKYGKAIPGELSRYIESGDKLYDFLVKILILSQMLEFLYILKRKDVNMEINMKTVKFIGFLI